MGSGGYEYKPAFLRNSEDDECPVLEMEVKRLD
jgi:hypothetical protein